MTLHLTRKEFAEVGVETSNLMNIFTNKYSGKIELRERATAL
jgi:hypothetical protein